MIIRNAFLYSSIAILSLAWIAPLTGPTLGRIEGRMFPVLDPTLTIASVQEMQEYESRISGTGFKARGNCVYIAGSLRWYLGRPGNGIEVPAEFREPPRLRGEGSTSWTGIVVGLSEAQIRYNSFAEVSHDCGWPWLTVTTFYRSAPPAVVAKDQNDV